MHYILPLIHPVLRKIKTLVIRVNKKLLRQQTIH